jgi:hypothetical protein
MSEKNPLANRRKGLEEEYFRRKEKELLEKLRRRAETEQSRKAMADASSIADDDILTTLQELGYTRDTVRLLHLVPLVQVGWMSGSVTAHEREMILQAAGLHGIAPDTEAYRQLNDWFDHRPTDQFFEQTLAIIRQVLGTLPPEEHARRLRSLSTFCLSVAEASGGILGIGKVSAAEQEILERIASELQRSGPAAIQTVIEAD